MNIFLNQTYNLKKDENQPLDSPESSLTLRKEKIFLAEFFLAASLINILIALTISNYNTSSLIYKFFSASVFITATWFNSRQNTSGLIDYLKRKETRNIILLTSLFILISGLMLLYSSNSTHGFQKLIAFVIIQVPMIIFFNYVIVTNNSYRVRIFLYTFSIFITAVSVISLIINPFDPTSVYSFEIGRWSHIVLGRVTGLLLLALLIFLIYREPSEKSNGNDETIFYASPGVTGLAAAAFIAGFINIIYMTSRGVFFSLLFIMIILLVKNHIKGGKRIKIILSMLFIPLLAGILLITFTDKIERFNQIFLLKFDDEQIQSRIFQFEKSIEIIKENPVTGTGLGGFRNYNNNPDLDFLKYPHNIFLEFLTEYGVIIGGLFSIALLTILFKGFRKNFITGLFILYAFLLMQTSKDISSQFWFLLALYQLYDTHPFVSK